MIPISIGVGSGLLTILLVYLLRLKDKNLVYGLILSGIGFLYVGFAWTDLQALMVNALQAVVFLLLAYYGVKKCRNLLALGYFLHGCWDMLYSFFANPGLIPPHYDLFCLSIDFTIGLYLLWLNKQTPMH